MRFIVFPRYSALIALIILAIFPTLLISQTTVGIQPFGSYQSDIDQINLADLGVHIDIPLFSHKARGLNNGTSIHMIYDTAASLEGNIDAGWSIVGETTSGGYIWVHVENPQDCSGPGGQNNGQYTLYDYAFIDSTGFPHPFAGYSYDSYCTAIPNPDPTTTLNESASDGSGYILSAQGSHAVVKAPSGTVFEVSGIGGTTITDSNGNVGKVADLSDFNGLYGYFGILTDDSNITAQINGGMIVRDSNGQYISRNPTIIQYTDAAGNPQQITIAYQVLAADSIQVTSVTFPDGSAYHFTYQPPPFRLASPILASIQLPTGGIITYHNTWSSSCQTASNSLVRATSDGTTTYTRTVDSSKSNRPCDVIASTTDISKADGSSERIHFVGADAHTGAFTTILNYETSHSWKTPSGTIIKSTMRCYNGATGDCTMTPLTLPLSQISTITTLDNSQSYKTTEFLNNLSLPTELDEYDFGASVPLRKTLTVYASLGNNILDRPSSVTVLDGNANQISQTTYGYDEYSLAGTSSSLPGHVGISGSRGNQTSVRRWLNTTGSTLDSHYTYDDAGQMISASDPKGNLKQFTYDSATDQCLTTTTYPMASGGTNFTTSGMCNPTTGLIASTTDLNGHVTYYDYDSMLRLTSTSYPGGSNTAVNYSGASLPETVTTTIAAAPSPNEISSITLDGYGRTSQTTAPGGPIVKTVYDQMGNIHSVSNPYFNTSDPTYGLTTYIYDALGRKLAETHPDNSTSQWSYSGNVTTATDEAGHQWQRQSDALGRLTYVVEPGGLATAYTYDALDNLQNVTQAGTSGDTPRIRTFSYDSLSRLVCSSNPENSSAPCPTVATGTYTAGTTGFAYDANGNLQTKISPAPNAVPGSGQTITTGLTYDALNRLTHKQAPGINYAYSYDSISPLTSNGIGRLVYASNSVNADEVFSYDPMGRLNLQYSWTPLSPNHTDIITKATYDLAGNLTGLTYPDGRTVSQGFDGAGRVSSVNYASWNSNAKLTPYLTVNSTNGYDPAGHLINATMGNGVSMAAAYDSRERVGALAYGTATQLLWGKLYQWSPNSNLQMLTDGLTGVQRQFGYDDLSRLTSAQDIFGPTQGVNTSPFPTGSGGGAPGSSGGATPLWTDPDDSNILVNPDTPGAGGWNAPNATIVGGIAAPDGTATASSFTASAGSTDTYLTDAASGPYLYGGETMTGSVWLRSPSGTQNIDLYIVETGEAGFGVAAAKAVTVTTTWQQFQLSGQVQHGLTSLLLQVGGASSITNGQTISLWSPKLEDSGTSGSTVTNFLSYSQRLTSPTWGIQAGTAVNNSAPAPDGTNTAATVTANSGSNDSWFIDNVPNPAPYNGLTLTGSVWLRSPNGSQSILLTLITDGWSPVGATTVALTSDWQRFQVSATNVSTTGVLQLQIGGASTFTNGQSVQVWGAQVELASSAGPYVATAANPASAGTNLTNILPYSQQPNGPSWGIAGASVSPNAVTAPDGSMTGYQISALPGVSDAFLTDDVINPALYDGATVTGSIFMRSASGAQSSALYLVGENASGRTYLGAQVVQLTSEWKRFTITGQMPNGLIRIFLQAAGGGTLSAGQAIDIWGAQLELAASAGPYVATSALPVVAGKELTNILPNSQQLSGPSWGVVNGSAMLNSATAPDGTPTAAIATANTGSSDTYVIDNVPNPSLYDQQTVTGSVYLRVASGTLNTYLYLINVGESGWGIPNDVPITLTTTWQRFSVTGTNQNGLTQFSLQIGGAGAITSGQSIQIWGAQMVIGTAAAPYTPTVGGTTNVATGQPATLVPTGLNQVYSYDSFGNIQQNGSFSSSYTANNQMFGYAYDAAGNLLANGFTNMTWNADNQLISAGGATYIYDAEGNRVEKQGVGVTDTISFDGRPIARLSAGGWTDLIYGPNGMLAEVAGTENAVPTYRLLDHLGTEVGTVGSNALLTNPLDYTPFGQLFSGLTDDPYQFTGKERDTESGNDYFGARYYASTMGRFSSPDPSGLYFADPSNPQSFNLYSYVRNNPLSLIDPDGLETAMYGDANCMIYTYDWYTTDKDGTLNVHNSTDHFGSGCDRLQNAVNNEYLNKQPVPQLKPQSNKWCSAHANATGFVNGNMGSASDLANQLSTAPANILGQGANESGWGSGNVTAHTNNYFGLTAGKAFAGNATGTWYDSGNGNTYETYASPGFANSGQAWANSWAGKRVQGVQSAADFDKAINAGNKYNSEKLQGSSYSDRLLGATKTVLNAIQCP